MKIKALRFGGLSFEPYSYQENSEDGLLITAKTVIDEGQQEELFALHRAQEFMPVIRDGVSPEPLSMRLGRCLWSNHGDRIKQEINLVDQEWDRQAEPFGLDPRREPFESRVMDLLAEKSEQLDALVRALVELGIVTSERAQQILDVSDDSLWRRKSVFHRVDDLDSFRD
jgi:hypothetical protein